MDEVFIVAMTVFSYFPPKFTAIEFNRLNKLFLILSLVGFVGYFSVIMLLRFGSAVVGELLQDTVESQSKGRYSLQYREIEVSPFQLLIEACDFSITKAAIESDTSAYTYIIDLPRVEISIHSFKDIYLKRSLQFEGIKLWDPRVRILKRGEKKEKSSLSFETGSLYRSMSRYLSELKIDSFQVANGAVAFTKTDQEDSLDLIFDQISLDLQNFLIDSVAGNDGFMMTDKIEFGITNQQFAMADSLHQLAFEELTISTTTRDILIKNLKISPKKQNGDYPYLLDLHIPAISFNGFDFERAYRENTLSLDSIELFEPDLNLVLRPRESTGTKHDPLVLILSIFPEIEIRKLSLVKAKLNLTHWGEQHSWHYVARETYARIYQFQIDSARYQLPFENYFEYAEVGASMLLASIDSLYALSLDQLAINTQLRDLSIAGLQVIPLTRSHPGLQSLKLGSLHAVAKNAPRKWQNDKIRLSLLEIKNPSLEFNLGTPSGIPLKEIEMDQFLINGGNFLLTNQDGLSFETQDANLAFSRFHLSQDIIAHKDFTKVATKSVIRLGNTHLIANALNLEMETFTSRDFRQFILTSIVVLDSLEEPFAAKSAALYGLDLDRALHEQALTFDSLHLIKPIVSLTKSNGNGTQIPLIQNTRFKSLIIENGELNKQTNGKQDVFIHNMDLAVHDFAFDSVVNQYRMALGYHIDSIYFAIPAIQHYLVARDFAISMKDSTAFSGSLSLAPISKDNPRQYRFSSHGFRLHQIEMMKLLNEKQLHFYTGYLISPKIDIKIKDSLRTKEQNLNAEFLKFHGLHVSNAEVNVNLIDRGEFHAQKLNLFISEFDQSKDSLLFHAHNYITDARNVSVTLPDRAPIFLQKASLNTKSGLLLLQDIEFSNTGIGPLSIDRIAVKGINSELLGKYNRLEADSLLIDNPVLKYQSKETKNESSQVSVNNISINYLGIRNAFVHLQQPELNLGDSIVIPAINLGMKKVILNKGDSFSVLLDNLPNTTLSIGAVNLALSDSLHRVGFGALAYNGANATLTGKNITLKPVYNRREFQKHITYQTNRFDMTLDELKLDHFNPLDLIQEKRLASTRVALNGIHLETHRDKRLPLPNATDKPLPQGLLSSLPIQVLIDTIKISKGYISHSEFSETGTKPGMIFFQNLNATLRNVTNDSLQIARNNIMKFDSQGSLMNTGNFDLNVAFNLTHPESEYTLDGKVGNMDLTELNRLLENTAHVQVKSGINKLLTFNYTGNSTYAIGEMKFYYDDLKIAVLKSDQDQGHTAGIKSFFANTFVVSKRNPHFLFVRMGDIFHEHDQSKSIFNYWAKSLLSGIVSSIGAKNNKKEIKELYKQQKESLDKEKNQKTAKP